MAQVFEFLKLPDLVQYQVLTQTDLVANNAACFPILSRSRVKSEYNRYDSSERNPFGPRKATAPLCHPRNCFCQLCRVQPKHKPSYENRCPRCRTEVGFREVITKPCWTFPLNIFLVSKYVNTMAKTILFSKNRLFLWEDSLPPWPDSGPTASEFVCLDLTYRKLNRMPLASLRRLDLRLESFCALDDMENGKCYKLWKDLAELIKNATLAGRLTLKIDFGALNDEYFGSSCSWHDTWEAYQNIAAAFQHKERIFKEFFIHLASPFHGTYENDLLRWNRERELERRVMNDESYDSALRGKYNGCHLDESSGPVLNFLYVLDWTGCSELDYRDKDIQERIASGASGEDLCSWLESRLPPK